MQVYDVTNERSFENVCSRWVREVDRFSVDTITKFIIGNKADLERLLFLVSAGLNHLIETKRV